MNPIRIRSKRPSATAPNPGQDHHGDRSRRQLLLALELLVAILYFPALVLGPLVMGVIVFSYIGKWLGLLESLTINNGWVTIPASILFVVLYIVRKHIERELDDAQTSINETNTWK